MNNNGGLGIALVISAAAVVVALIAFGRYGVSGDVAAHLGGYAQIGAPMATATPVQTAPAPVVAPPALPPAPPQQALVPCQDCCDPCRGQRERPVVREDDRPRRSGHPTDARQPRRHGREIILSIRDAAE